MVQRSDVIVFRDPKIIPVPDTYNTMVFEDSRTRGGDGGCNGNGIRGSTNSGGDGSERCGRSNGSGGGAEDSGTTNPQAAGRGTHHKSKSCMNIVLDINPKLY